MYPNLEPRCFNDSLQLTKEQFKTFLYKKTLRQVAFNDTTTSYLTDERGLNEHTFPYGSILC